MAMANDPEPYPEPRSRETARKRLRLFLESSWFEKKYPIGAGAICSMLLLFFLPGDCKINCWALDRVVKQVLPLSIQVAAILAGFQAMAPAILLGVSDSEIVSLLRKNGHYERLVGYVSRACLWLLVYLVLAMVVLCDYETNREFYLGAKFTLSVLSGFYVFAFVASYRVIRLVTRLLAKSEST
ncbi:MAG: hypothetical protein H6814_07435 [Phycisphaeraceae bacterium]|nr:hypothetical protein [Phycisphaeraceae bacterium]